MSYSVASVAKGATSVNYRTVFIRVHPTPVKLAERRAVLRMVQRHGAVEMFKKLSDNKSFVSIMSTVAAATDLAKRSPITYDLVSEKFNSISSNTITGASLDITSPVEPNETDTGSSAASSTDAFEIGLDIETREEEGKDYHDDGSGDEGAVIAEFSVPNVEKAGSHKSFVLHAFYTGVYGHKTRIRQSPLHGPWPSEPAAQTSFVYSALADVVPDGHEAEGLCDWSSGGQLSDEGRILRWRQDGDEQNTANRLAVLAHVKDRQARRLRRREGATMLLSRDPPSPKAKHDEQPTGA